MNTNSTSKYWVISNKKLIKCIIDKTILLIKIMKTLFEQEYNFDTYNYITIDKEKKK